MNQHLRLAIIGAIASTCLLWFPASGQELSILKIPCLSASTASWISGLPVRSLIECLSVSRQVATSLQSVGFVQFDSRYLSCALFRYRDICQLLNMTSLGASRTQQTPVMVQQNCESLVDTKYDVVTANAYFAAVWVGGYGPALENLVCGQSGPRNPVVSSGVSWTSEGARMDGSTSRLMVNDSTGFNFSLGYTMAVELKRQTPVTQAFIEMTDCSTLGVMLDHLWELPAGELYSNNNFAYYTGTTHLLPSDPNEFFKAAVTCNLQAKNVKHFYGSTVVPSSAFTESANSGGSLNGKVCLKIGYRITGTSTLSGTVKMAAIANTNLPDDVVLRFLAGR